MAALVAVIGEVAAHRIHARLSALAAGLDDPDRTADQKRADILTDALLVAGPGTGSDRPSAPAGPVSAGPVTTGPDRAGGRGWCCWPRNCWRGVFLRCRGCGTGPLPRSGRVEVNVVVSLGTLLGLSQDPAQIPGLGPIPAETARELAADSTWRAWITDSTRAAATGRVIATGSRGYVPGEALARLVRAREWWPGAAFCGWSGGMGWGWR